MKMVLGGQSQPLHTASDDDANPIQLAMNEALKQLVDLDGHHANELAALSKLGVDQSVREVALKQLEHLHQKRRGPYVLRLAELHQRLRFGALFRQVH